MTDPADLTATDAARAIARGTLRPADLLEACHARAAAREPALQAMTAYASEHVPRQTPAPGLLHGLPIGIKDVIDT